MNDELIAFGIALALVATGLAADFTFGGPVAKFLCAGIPGCSL